jgi:N-acetylglucosaminyldiphosphoundecaprenol N-acetyl-beta-D-mannosaminyltransferase
MSTVANVCRSATEAQEPSRLAQASIGPRLPVAILGIPFDNLTISEAIGRIEQMIASRRPHYVVTANVDFLVQARRDIELRRILLDAHLVLCDGTPLVWASRLLGNALAERVAGADLVPSLIRAAARKQYRVFFLGATPEASAAAVVRLRASCPDLTIAGHYSPPFRRLLEMDHEEIRRRILAAAPDLLFVSFGCPKQEKWIAMHFRDLAVPVTIGVGATIDFLAGHVKRAPVWMQRTGTEWIFRLVQEPRRLFRRYAQDLWSFTGCLLAQWWRFQRGKPKSSSSSNPDPASRREPDGPLQAPEAQPVGYVESPTLPPLLVFTAVRREPTLATPSWRGSHCLLEASRVEFIDSTGAALLLHRQKLLRSQGAELVLLAPSVALRHALAFMRIEDFFLVAANAGAARAILEERAREQSEAVVADARNNSVAWRGEITVVTAPLIWQQTQLRLATSGIGGDCTIDLSGVRFIDSTGLWLMLRAKDLACECQRRVTFTGLGPSVRNALQLAQVDLLS